MNKEITKEEKIEVIKLTLFIIKIDYRYNGMCCHIHQAMKDLGLTTKSVLQAKEITQELIPGFNMVNAYKLSVDYGFTKPDGITWWWDSKDIEVRIKFLNALLEQIQNHE